jgi:hypothetical protein
MGTLKKVVALIANKEKIIILIIRETLIKAPINILFYPPYW